MDEAGADQFGEDHFATAQFAHLDIATGLLQWVNAGPPSAAARARPQGRPLDQGRVVRSI